MRSDHRPILLQVGRNISSSTPRQFRYFTGCSKHEDFARMVDDSWYPSSSVTGTILHFIHAAQEWNNKVFGYIGARKHMIMVPLRGIQRALSTRTSRYLKNMEIELLIELESVLDHEEPIWKQKSRFDWVAPGDRNTCYFHRQANAGKQRNRISSLKLVDGTWCSDASTLKNVGTKFYQSLFTCTPSPTSTWPNIASFSALEQSYMHSLGSIPSDQEIHEALMDMAPLKSLGWDGLHADFFSETMEMGGAIRL
ncbi:hypothetical protein V6N13_130273 [Hibiscus sabdariffa]